MYKIILLLLSFSLFASSAWAQEEIAPPLAKMDIIAKRILPLVFDTHQSNRLEAKKELHQHLAELHSNFEQASLTNMSAHLEQAQKYLEHKDETKAREVIKLMLSFCLAADARAHLSTQEKDLSPLHFASQFEIAEYNYIIQNYETAIIYYDHYLTSKKSQLKAKEQRRLALERLLSIYTQLERDPSITAAYLNEYQSYIIEPTEKSLLAHWIQELNQMNTFFDEKLQSPEPISFASLQEYATRILDTASEPVNPEADKIKRLILKGLVFNYLNEKSTLNEKEQPLLLKWLEQCYS